MLKLIYWCWFVLVQKTDLCFHYSLKSVNSVNLRGPDQTGMDNKALPIKIFSRARCFLWLRLTRTLVVLHLPHLFQWGRQDKEEGEITWGWKTRQSLDGVKLTQNKFHFFPILEHINSVSITNANAGAKSTKMAANILSFSVSTFLTHSHS